MSFYVVIPARYASTRLPAKPLKEIAGKPMIQHVYERACESDATQVIIATDDARIEAAALAFAARHFAEPNVPSKFQDERVQQKGRQVLFASRAATAKRRTITRRDQSDAVAQPEVRRPPGGNSCHPTACS